MTSRPDVYVRRKKGHSQLADSTLTATAGQALQAHRGGRLAAAEALYREVLVASPDDARTLHRLGLLLHPAGRAQRQLPVSE